eukprot:5807425-Prymnesium_polylepis.1
MEGVTLISVAKFSVRSRVRARQEERMKRVFARISWYLYGLWPIGCAVWRYRALRAPRGAVAGT